MLCTDTQHTIKFNIKIELNKIQTHKHQINNRDLLTKIVNFPVSSSLRNGSDIGSKLYRPSCLRMSSCCSNSATARCTSNFRASRNLSAVAGDIVFRSTFLLTTSINSFTAWKAKQTNVLLLLYERPLI